MRFWKSIILATMALAFSAMALLVTLSPTPASEHLLTVGGNGFSLSRWVSGSEVIVHGKVTSVAETIVELRGVRTPYRITHIEPFEILKGMPNTTSGNIEVWDLGGHDDRGYLMVVEGEVVFSEGDEVVVFLSWLGPEEKRYLSPNGWRQGTFVVDPGPDRTVRISEVAARDFRVEVRPSEHHDEVLVLLDDFLENVRRLLE